MTFETKNIFLNGINPLTCTIKEFENELVFVDLNFKIEVYHKLQKRFGILDQTCENEQRFQGIGRGLRIE